MTVSVHTLETERGLELNGPRLQSDGLVFASPPCVIIFACYQSWSVNWDWFTKMFNMEWDELTILEWYRLMFTDIKCYKTIVIENKLGQCIHIILYGLKPDGKLIESEG